MAVRNQTKSLSRETLKWRVFAIFVLTALCLLVVFPVYANKGIDWVNKKANVGLPNFPSSGFNLGLDLQGGAHLIYQADTKEIPEADKASAVEGVRDVVERRVRGGLGVSEPLVQTTKVNNDFRIIVELPGVTDVNQAIKMIGETPILEFKQEDDKPLRPLTPAETKQMNDYNAAAQAKAKEASAAINSGALSFPDAVTQYSEDEKTKTNGGELGLIDNQILPDFYKWASTHQDGEVSKEILKSPDGLNIVKRISSQEGTVGPDAVTTTLYKIARVLIKTKQPIDIVPPAEQWKSSGLSGKQLKRTEVSQDSRTGQVQVALQFNEEGTQMFADLTKKNVGKPIAIFLDGTPISIPVVNEPILNGSAVISGSFSIQEARLLAQRLNSGALPVPVELISQQKVGATLGADSLAKSFKAGVAGLLAVIIFMIFYYRLPGILAGLALMVYASVALAIFKLIGVTLTLSGIAGFILSIGVAVDANVLVFERLKEELKSGKTLRSGMEEAFIRAWPSIRDSNVSALISCVCLIWFGTGFVKGFAVTLAIGVLVSMFTAIIVTRTIMRLVVPWFKENGNWAFLGHQKEVAQSQVK